MAENENGYSLPYEDVFDEIERQHTEKQSQAKNLIILIISLFVFFNLGLIKNGVSDIIIIMFVLMMHECGHYLGMRLFKYQNLQMFFIPFFGAAVSGESRNVPVYKKALITLMGPGPGILLSIILYKMYFVTKAHFYVELARMFLIINAFNLLPIFPLDGGRLLREVIFSRNRYMEFVSGLAAAILLILSGYLLGTWILTALGVFNLITIGIPFKISSIVKEIKEIKLKNGVEELESEERDTVETIPPGIGRKIIDRIYERFSKVQIKAAASYTRDVWERVQIRPAGISSTIGLLGLYFICIFLTIFGLLGEVMIRVVKQEANTKRAIIEYIKPEGKSGFKEQVYIGGKLSYEIELSDDKSLYHGRGLTYGSNGSIIKDGNWHEGRWDGEWKFYKESGYPEKVVTLNKGEILSYKEWDGSRWIEKINEDIPYWFRKMIKKEYKRKPKGPKAKEYSMLPKEQFRDVNNRVQNDL